MVKDVDVTCDEVVKNKFEEDVEKTCDVEVKKNVRRNGVKKQERKQVKFTNLRNRKNKISKTKKHYVKP